MVSLLAPGVATLEGLDPAVWAGADRIELRLDRFESEDLPHWAAWIQACPLPVVASLHGAGGLGSPLESPDAHLARLQDAVRAGASHVDVDWKWALDPRARFEKAARIVSRHVLDPHADWRAAYQELCSHAEPTDRIKFVVAVEYAEQGLEIMDWVHRQAVWPGGRSAFCMGERGAFTRLLALAQADAWVYCAPRTDPSAIELEPAAPGQWTLADWQAMAPPSPGAVQAWEGIIGTPVRHSLSPMLHGQALRKAQEPVGYLPLDPRDLAGLLEALRPYRCRGFAVTAPYKREALALATDASPAARALGAANTLRWTPQGWFADNTDWIGVRDVLVAAWGAHAQRWNLDSDWTRQRAIVLGGGGAARAALHALRSLGCQRWVCTRDSTSGRALAQAFDAAWLAPWELDRSIDRTNASIWIHTTPLGSQGRGLLLPPGRLQPEHLVFDAVYQPAHTPLVDMAHQAGCTVVGGAAWLLAQAQEQYRRINGSMPDAHAMQAVLHGHQTLYGGLPPGPVVLMGMPGAGKSTLGPLLAAALEVGCTDVDQLLAQDFAAEHGEALLAAPRAVTQNAHPVGVGQALEAWGLEAFRAREARHIERALQAETGVLVLGGGALETPAVRSALAQRGTLVWLHAPLEELARRTRAHDQLRPAVTEESDPGREQAALWARRAPWFAEWAHVGYASDAEEGAASLVQRLAQLGFPLAR
ncbi:MAG: type I 3-dehydroquinate dehydratase [Planctomycetes bacterium]|nr:type I 3-dehydroquinate dehydratase [Planctomycetota bacterium]